MYNSTLHNDSVKFLVGVNTSYKGKTGKDRVSGAGFWKNTEHTAQSLADHIAKGYGWMPSLIDKGHKRWQVHCNTAHVLAADIDNEMTLEQAKEHPFIKQYAILIIESSSSTSEHNKFRVVFRYQQPIKGWENIRALNTYLIHEILGVADKSCKDASRFFFGAENRPVIFLNEDARLPQSFIDAAFAYRKKEEAIAAERQRKAEEFSNLIRESVNITDLRSIAVQALSYTSQRIIKGETYDEVFRCLASLVHEFGESDAVSMMEAHSPSYRSKDGEWDVSKTARSIARGSSSGKQCRIGTLFDYAVKGGWSFPPELKKLQQEYVLAHGGGLGYQKPKSGDYKKKKIEQVKERLNPEERAIAKKVINIVPGSTPVNPLEVQANESQFKQWKTFTTKFTHNYEICCKYLSVDLFKDKIDINTWGFFGRSPLGSGKTYMLKPNDEKKTPGLIAHIEKLHGHTAENPIGGGVLGYRNVLLGQTKEAIGGELIAEVSESDKKKPGIWLLGCVNSMDKFPPGFFKGKILVLDELNSVIEHKVAGSTCYDNRTAIFNGFAEAVRDAAFIVCLDANMSDWAVDFITSLKNPSSELNVLKLNNATTSKDDIQVEVIATFSQKEITQKIMELAPLYYAKGLSIAIASDSQRFLEKISNILTEMGFYVLRLDSKTTHMETVMAFITKPESVPTPFCLSFSPVCDSGLNASDPRFAHVFAYFCGVIGTTSQMQMLRRPRAATKMTISCVPYTRMNLSSAGRKTEYIEDQKAAFLSTEKFFAPEVFQEAKAKWEASEEGIHYKTLWDLKFYRNYERKNTLECLIEILKVHGYSPTLIDDGTTTGQMQEELVEHRKLEAIAISESRMITDQQAEELESRSPWTQQEIREYRAWEIRTEFSDWGDNWTPEWIFEKDTELINRFDYKERLKEVGKIIQIKDATGIFNANDITARQAESLRIKVALTPKERYELDRYKIKQELFGIEHKDGGKFWNIDGIVEISKRLYNITDLKIRWAYENLEKAREMRQWKWISDLEEDRFIGDCLQNHYGKAKLLKELNLDELPEEFTGDTDLVRELASIARSKKVRLRRTLGVVKGQMENIPWLNRLLFIIGKKTTMTGRVRGESRTYKIAEDDELGKAIYECVSVTLEKQYQNGLEAIQRSKNMVHNHGQVVQVKADNSTEQDASTTQNSTTEPIVVVGGDIEIAKIRRYDRFLYRGHEAIYLRAVFGDLEFYFPVLKRVIPIAPAFTGELIRLDGLPSIEQQNWIDQNIA